MKKFTDPLPPFQSDPTPYEPFEHRPPSRLRLFLRRPYVKATTGTALLLGAAVAISGLVPLINPPV